MRFGVGMSPAVQTRKYGSDIRVVARRRTTDAGANYALLVCGFFLIAWGQPIVPIPHAPWR
jgi:hypothetical protein